MNYKVIPVDKFKKEAKRLVKKYPSLKSELAELAVALSVNPTMGTALGHEAYKIRVSIKSKGKGKAKGRNFISPLRQALFVACNNSETQYQWTFTNK